MLGYPSDAEQTPLVNAMNATIHAAYAMQPASNNSGSLSAQFHFTV